MEILDYTISTILLLFLKINNASILDLMIKQYYISGMDFD